MSQTFRDITQQKEIVNYILMPSYPIRKTSSGDVYDVRFRIINQSGTEIQKRLCGYPTKKAAQQAYIDFMKSYTPPTFTLNKDGQFLFDDLLSLYKKSTEMNIAPSSDYDRNCIFDKFIVPYFAGKRLPEIKKIDYVNWQTALWALKNPTNDEYYSHNYLSKIRTSFSGFLSWCEDTYDIPNLLKNIKKPKRKIIKSEMQVWVLDEFQQFQAAADDVLWQTFFTCLYYSGCRVGELLALSDDDVILDNGVFSLNIHKNIIRRGLPNGQSYAVVPPKTESSNRTVALPKSMTTQIELYKAYKAEQNIASDFFFGGDAPIAEMTYQRAFKKYIELAGLKKIRIHDLRHSHASLLIHLNVPITVISKRLGHTSIDMTLKKYAHCFPTDISLALEAIDAAICAINVP